jgi:hypothetical protein
MRNATARHQRSHPASSSAERSLAERPIRTLRALAKAEAACTRCPLYRCATRVVPGEGPARAPLMLVGEQPGDQANLTRLARAARQPGFRASELFIASSTYVA